MKSAAWLLPFLALMAIPTALADAPTNFSLPDLAKSFWTETGLKFPSKALTEAVTRAKLPVLDAAGHRREIVLMAIANEFAFHRMFDIFLTSLSNITFKGAGGSEDNLARHLIINIMTNTGTDNCTAVAGKYGAICVPYGNSHFTLGTFHAFSNEFYGIGFIKTATILDGLTVGVDVLFLDADQVVFKNPLPYILAREADVLVTGDCHNHLDSAPMDRLPQIGNNIGLIYFRATAMVTRAVYNWCLWLANIAYLGGKPWDQTTFAVIVEWVAADVTVRHMSIAMLRPDKFPFMCMGPCGCDLRNVPYYHWGKQPRRTADNTCEPALMREWYCYHMPCSGDMNNKAKLMEEYTVMYHKVIGPINSLSEPMTVLRPLAS